MPLTPQTKPVFQAALMDDKTCATTLVVALADLFGTVEYVNWEPESIQIELEEVLGVRWSKMPKVIQDRIQASAMALSTNQFYVSLESFINVVNAYAGAGVDFETFDPATIEESALACMEMRLQDGEIPAPELYSQEIRHYLGVRAEYEGMTRLPRALFWAEKPKKPDSNPEDADGYAAKWRGDLEKAERIDDKVRERHELILRQVAALPLMNRDEETWKEFYGKHVKG